MHNFIVVVLSVLKDRYSQYRPQKGSKPYSATALSICLVLLAACGYFRGAQTQKRMLTTPAQAESLDKRSPFLKAHMPDGSVYILSQWRVESNEKTVSGKGELLDVNRHVVKKDIFTIPLDSVALFETNVVQTSPSVAAMSIITGLSLGLTVYCAANPKACFGSCPTFYVSDGERLLLQSEGFSSSITRALEDQDVDALYRAWPAGRDLEVHMKNEALETHVMRYIHLLAALRPEGGRVFATPDGDFWQAQNIMKPYACVAPEGDCLAALQDFDGFERFSTTDPNDLVASETIDLEFKVISTSNIGLVIASRQSLLTTFLFYQNLAYMGRSAGQWLATLERRPNAQTIAHSWWNRLLGGIKVLIQDKSGEWVSVGEINETGPLATDVHLIPLPNLGPGPLKIRLRLTRGGWRLDYVALVELDKRVKPLRLRPFIVLRNGVKDNYAKKLLTDLDHVLVTLPGDEYTIIYRLPKDFENYELFLESRGYYFEWMREEWLTEENSAKAAMMFLDPKSALRTMAPKYKKIESEMEEIFWNSRYVRR